MRVLLITLLLQLLFLNSLSATVNSPHILILNSYNQGHPGTDSLIQGFQRIITEKIPEAQFQFEYLDSKNYSGPLYDESLFQLLNYKYKNRPFDLILASDDYAYNFVEQNYAALFPDVPVIFCGTNNFDINRLEGKNNFWGVDERLSFKKTVGLIFRLFPATKKVIVIHDTSITGTLNSKAFRTEIGNYEKQAVFDYWVDQPLEVLLENIQNLPTGTAIIYFTSYVKGLSGEFHNNYDALKILSAASSAPLFGFWEFGLNHGFIGGKVMKLSEHGALAGQIATKVLMGEKNEIKSKLYDSPQIYMFDDVKLKQFSIPDSKLPKGSIIVNRPPSFYQQHKVTLFAVLAFIFGLLAVVASVKFYTSRNMIVAYRKQLLTEKALQREMAFSTTLINTAQLIILILDVNGHIKKINPYMESITGYKETEVKGNDWFDTFLPPADNTELRAKFRKTIANIDVNREIYPIETKDGQQLMIEWHNNTLKDEAGAVLGLLSFGIDITERMQIDEKRQELETQLNQKHKMEAVGVMAGGMAHNFNNNLSIILGNIELAQKKLPENIEMVGYLNDAKIAVLRSRDLIRQIMFYSRQDTQYKTSIQLSVLLDETLQLLRATLPATINVQTTVTEDGRNATIHADASRLQECLINLCNNAMQAMDEKGNLTICLKTEDVQKEDIPSMYDAHPGHYAKLSITDTGCGMAKETIEKAFDLFYTTKPVNEGTGVGLSTVQGIVNQHNGLIKVKSHLGEGTTFDLFFPVTAQPQVSAPKNSDEEEYKGAERILFIDDDEMLADIGSKMLTEMGYQVTMVTESQKALQLFMTDADSFDLVITDQTMPLLTGKELINKLKQIKPSIPTIICTGYSSKVDKAEAKKLGADAFMMKPLELSALLQIIRQVLDRKKE
ncbi:hybrid sensor histidine kinase/response regulator [Desulfuromusa kysingii]|uniref:hybrid sensor histidine kinase/response regulator n=1 Tax=Desulfuromusa kysingii TaxID=37625 RepID=UPI0015874297|nr:response regulator [Desulfuromusa kysingii]